MEMQMETETETEWQMVSLDPNSNYAVAFHMTRANKCVAGGKWSCGHRGSPF